MKKQEHVKAMWAIFNQPEDVQWEPIEEQLEEYMDKHSLVPSWDDLDLAELAIYKSTAKKSFIDQLNSMWVNSEARFESICDKFSLFQTA